MGEEASAPSASDTPFSLTGLPRLPSDFNEKLKETGSVAAAMGDKPTGKDKPKRG